MPEMFLASFVNGRLFGQPMASMGEERFMTYMDLYNIGWIAAHSAEAKGTLRKLAKVVEMKRCETVTVYRVDRPLSYFLEGRGVVAASQFNNLVLDGLEGHRIVLKYNYLPGLK